MSATPPVSGILAGKVVVVTGGGRGIGRECALLAAREGAAVLVSDPGVSRGGEGHDAAPAEEVAAEIRAEGGQGIADATSLTAPGAAQTIVETAMARFGRIDAVINTAGILRDAIWHKMSRADWDAVIDVHLNGAFAICQAATPYFREQRSGAFILFTSSAGLVGNIGQANYAAAKLATVGLMQSIALDMARVGVRANCIAPIAWSRMIAGLLPDPDSENPQIAMMRALSADKVAPLAAYLASDASAAITNQIFGVSGDEVTIYSRPRPIARIARAGGWTAGELAAELPGAFAGAFAKADEIAGDVG